MRTTIELPDALLARAKSQAALEGQSLKEFFIDAVEIKLRQTAGKTKRRLTLPVLGDSTFAKVEVTSALMAESIFGPLPGAEPEF